MGERFDVIVIEKLTMRGRLRALERLLILREQLDARNIYSVLLDALTQQDIYFGAALHLSILIY